MTMKRLMLVWVMMLCLAPLGGWAETPADQPLVCGDFQYILLAHKGSFREMIVISLFEL